MRSFPSSLLVESIVDTGVIQTDGEIKALERVCFTLNRASYSPVSPAKVGAQVKPTSRSG
jgi:hypothetical protein